jgi:microcystin-dependent protein
LACEGQAVSRVTYAALFTNIGTTYGEGDKSTTFNVPNFTERVPVGVGSASGFKRGEKGGASTVTLTLSQIPAHKHPVVDPGHAHGVTDPTHNHGLEQTISYVGGGNGGQTGSLGHEGYNNGFVGVGYSKTNIAVNSASTGVSTSNEGGSTSHTNIQPYETCNVWIKT